MEIPEAMRSPTLFGRVRLVPLKRSLPDKLQDTAVFEVGKHESCIWIYREISQGVEHGVSGKIGHAQNGFGNYFDESLPAATMGNVRTAVAMRRCDEERI